MSDSAPLRIALLGAGNYGRGVHLPVLRDDAEFEVACVFSRSLSRAREAAAECGDGVRATDDLERVLADPSIDAVDVALPIPQLAPVVRRALAAGKHVVSEKPIARDVREALDLITYAERHPAQVWMVAENWRYEAALVRAAELVQTGAIGRPVMADWSAGVPIRPGHRYHATAWRREGAVPGGFLIDAGVHYVAALRAAFGEVSEARAVSLSVHDDLPPADTLAASLAFECGAVVSLTLTFAADTPFTSTLRVTGLEGALEATRERIELSARGERQVETFERLTGVRDELRAFARAVRAGTPHRNTPGEALADLRVMEALLRDAGSLD